MAKSFTAQLDEIIDLTERNLRYVAAESIQDVVEAAQTPQLAMSKGAPGFVEGKIPVAEADLINSLSVDGGAPDKDAYSVAIAGYQIGDNMRFAWTSEYAMRIEAGFTGEDSLGRSYNVPGRFFVGKNAARFPEFVKKRVAEVRK